MSKLGKCILIGFIIFVIGAIIMVTALGLSGWSLDGEYETSEFVCDRPIYDIKVEIGVGNLDVKFYDGEFIKVVYQHNKSMKSSISQFDKNDDSDNRLEIQNEMRFRIFNFGRWLKKSPNMTIYIPNGNVVDLQCNVNAGVANVESGKFGNVSVVLNAGTLNFENIESNRFYVKLNAGNVKLQNLSAVKTNVIVNAGDFKIAQMDCVELNFELNAGNFHVKDMTCDLNTIEINAGTFTIEKIKTDQVDAKLNAGNLNMTVQGIKSEFNIEVEKNSGSCNLSNQSGTNLNKKIKVKINSGNVTVQFEE